MDDEFEELVFRHPSGCAAQQVLQSDGTVGNLFADLVLLVPQDREGWTGVSCAACGRELREVDDDA